MLFKNPVTLNMYLLMQPASVNVDKMAAGRYFYKTHLATLPSLRTSPMHS